MIKSIITLLAIFGSISILILISMFRRKCEKCSSIRKPLTINKIHDILSIGDWKEIENPKTMNDANTKYRECEIAESTEFKCGKCGHKWIKTKKYTTTEYDYDNTWEYYKNF